MALPAGRYGVTKNQLLRIKKLPMNTIKLIEELTEKFDLLGSAAFKNSTSVVTDSTDLVESGAVYTALQSKADNFVIAPVENGDNASQAYAVGQHFMNGGVLKEVTNPIANGDAINSGNTKNTTVSNAFMNKNNGILSTVNEIYNCVSNLYDSAVVSCQGTLMAILTNNELSYTGKLVIQKSGATMIDWFGMIGGTNFACGRLNNYAYNAHTIIK